ncbi:hypothetical protein [Streptomyces sp. NPDC058861]|uniref:hypothetical protein n=1 Tax=Streptomyces sp. NPDC058861 TaxID=3346653 RepID=UPI003687B54B
MSDFDTNWAAVYAEADAHPTIDPAGHPTATVTGVYVVSGYRGTSQWHASLPAAIQLRNALTEVIDAHTAEA